MHVCPKSMLVVSVARFYQVVYTPVSGVSRADYFAFSFDRVTQAAKMI